MEKRRRIIAAFLLAVFLPALVAAYLHKHPERLTGDAECVACAGHIPHPGHLTSDSGAIQDCILCTFLGLPFLKAFTLPLIPVLRRLATAITPLKNLPCLCVQDCIQSRAPPVQVF